MTHDQTRQALGRAVELATAGAASTPRAAQLDLSRRVWEAMEGTGQCAVQAPTGTGKTLAYLIPAALRAARDGERTVVSTESLSLQQQIADKDAPVAVRAVESLTGQSVSVAVYKGWQNTACAMSAVRLLQALMDDSDGAVPLTRDGLLDLTDAAAGIVTDMPPGTRITVDGDLIDAREALGPAAWAVRASASGAPADRHCYPDPITERQWASVSVSAADCLGTHCPLQDFCRPLAAKQQAAAADIVITNHTLLGIQAAKRVPVVLSSRSLGRFHHVVVDEAHGLPDAVRKQGESTIFGRRLSSLIRDVERGIDQCASGGGPTGARSAAQCTAELAGGAAFAARIDDMLRATAATVKDQARLADGVNPLGELSGDLVEFTVRVSGVIRALGFPGARDTEGQRLRLKLGNRLTAFRAALDAVSGHRPGVARWLEQQPDRSWVAKASPAQVADALRHQVWVTEPVDRADPPAGGPGQGEDVPGLGPSTDNALDRVADESGTRVVVPLSVILVSATLLRGLGGARPHADRRGPVDVDRARDRRPAPVEHG